MSEAIQAMTKTDLAGAYSRALGRIRSAKAEVERMTTRGVGAMVNVGAGWATGVARSTLGTGPQKRITFPGTQVDVDLTAGVVGSLLGISGVLGDAGDHVLEAGKGVLAGYAAIHGFQNPIK